MEVIRISEENAADFSGYIDNDIQSCLSRRFFRGIGTVDDNSSPVGAFVYELLGQNNDESVRSRIHSMKANDDAAKDLLMSEYQVGITEEDAQESFYELEDEEADAFFKSRGFDSERIESDEIECCVSDLDGITKRLGGSKLPSYITDISEISIIQYRTFLKKAFVHGQFGSLEDIAYLPVNWFDRELSSCSMADGKIDGMFLVHRSPSGILTPCLLFTMGIDSKKNLRLLLVSTILKVTTLCPGETRVRIRRRNPMIRNITDKLFPEKKGAEIFFGKRSEGNGD
ncbi:MAG: hypothetical protein IJI65_01385 [Lachnospiraceae bacterium]|nr:hypothetical protein [Lachnospiraceae bacterium]